jgi:hypothetical protein
MPAKTTRDRIIGTLRGLPADASFEDAIERIVFLAKLEESQSHLDSRQTIHHEEVRRLGRLPYLLVAPNDCCRRAPASRISVPGTAEGYA